MWIHLNYAKFISKVSEIDSIEDAFRLCNGYLFRVFTSLFFVVAMFYCIYQDILSLIAGTSGGPFTTLLVYFAMLGWLVIGMGHLIALCFNSYFWYSSRDVVLAMKYKQMKGDYR